MDEQQQQQRTAETLERRVLALREQLRPLERLDRELKRAQAQTIAELGYDPARPPRPPRIEGVAWRCEPCSRSLGRHAPALAILERIEGPRPWVIHKIATWGRTWELPGRPRTQDRIVGPHTETNHYGCRRCRYKPRVKAPELFALADQAHAAGRDYFYR